MRASELCFETHLSVPLERLFAFFDRTDNLGVLMDGYRDFRLDASGTRGRGGEPVRVRVRLGPLWLAMEFRCCARRAPHLLAERQTRGPFAHLLHRHEFLERDGTAVMVDRLRFAVPARLGGRLAARLLVEPAIRRMFRFRRRRLLELARRGALGEARAVEAAAGAANSPRPRSSRQVRKETAPCYTRPSSPS